jgi:hypothetical protein
MSDLFNEKYKPRNLEYFGKYSNDLVVDISLLDEYMMYYLKGVIPFEHYAEAM